MNKLFLKLPALVLTLVVGILSSSTSFGQANIVIENVDAAGVGFNDPTAATPVGGNTGTTIGQQRLIAFQRAAAIWGATLPGGPTITVRSSWDTNLQCIATSGTLGAAGATGLFANFQGAPHQNTWYGSALANTLAGVDLDAANAEIRARFNPDIGTPGCLQNSHWYYGLDANDPNSFGSVDLVTVLLHEFAHGLGFQTFTSSSTGVPAGTQRFPSIYDRFLLDNTSGKLWKDMTDAERMSSAVNSGNLVWSGPQVLGDATFLAAFSKDAQGHPRVFAPDPVQGGSSISHWDSVATPNQLMEPNISSNLSHAVRPPEDLTFSLLTDIGWCASNCPPAPPPPSPTPTPPVPANNNFANAQLINGCSGSVTGTNVGANKEVGEPSHDPLGDEGGGSVWYQWTAVTSTSVTITTLGSDYDTMLGVYTGNSVNGLTPIAKNDDVDTAGGILSSTVTFNATAGTVYKIAVDGWGGDTGNITLNWMQTNCSTTKTDQTITFPPLVDRTFGDAPFPVTASASSGLPVSFSIVSGPATVSGNTVTLTGAGFVTVRASQAGDANFNAAPSVDQSFTVANTKTDQTISFPPLADRTFGDAPFSVTASASSGLPVSFSIVSGPATVSGNTVTLTGAGVVTVRASQAGDANFNAAPSVDQSFTVAKASQTITFNALANKTFGDAPFNVNASSSSGLAISFSIVSGPATVSGNTVTLTGAGFVTVRASQAGDANFNAAPSVDQSFTVAKANQTITFNALANKTFGDAPFNVSASSSSGLAISFSIVSGPATISGNTVTLTGAGHVTVRASQAGDANFNAAPSVDQSFTVDKANQTITFNALANKIFGDAPFNVNATSSSNLPVSFSIVSGPATISGNTISITGAGSVTVRASQGGDSNFNAATVDGVFTVDKASQMITFNSLPSKTFGDSPFAITATASSGLSVTFQIVSGPATISGNTVTITGTGLVTIRALQSGDANYNSAPAVDRIFNVVSGNANISLSNLAHIYNGSVKLATVTTNPTGLNVTVSYSLNGSPVTTPVNAGEYNVTATINDPNFQGSTTGTLVINKATPVITWNNPANIIFGTPLGNAQFNATANVPGNFQYSPAAGTVLSVGTYQLTTIFVPADIANFLSTGANVQLTVVPSSALQFNATSFQVNEGGGTLQIIVSRDDSSAAATVNFATSDTAGLVACTNFNGKASERCDYVTSVGTLRFAAGEASKSFTIPIIDDVHLDGNETFTVTLSNAVGAPIGTPSTATVTILDNDTPGAANPFDNNQFFITMQYIDFLGRLPDPNGLAGWLAVLNGPPPCPNNGFGNENPTCDRVHVSSGFFLSDEFRGRGYWAYRFYEVALNRRPNYAEFVPDMAKVGGPQSPESEELSKSAYKDEFVQRGVFTSLYNGLSNAQFVDAIEANAEVNLDNVALTAQLDGGKSRAQLLREIVESKPVEDQFFIRAFVAMQYFGYLRRDPDTDGYNGWVTTLTSNPSDFRHMIFGFIYSEEYRTRFGP